MSHIWMGRVSCMNASQHTYWWVVAHVWMSHDIYTNKSRTIYKRVMAQIWMSHGSDINTLVEAGSALCAWIHGTHMNESRHTYDWDMSQISTHRWKQAAPCVRLTWAAPVCHDSFIWVTWLIHTSDMTRSCVNAWHDVFACVQRIWVPVCHDSFKWATWLVHTWIRDMTCFLVCRQKTSQKDLCIWKKTDKRAGKKKEEDHSFKWVTRSYVNIFTLNPVDDVFT